MNSPSSGGNTLGQAASGTRRDSPRWYTSVHFRRIALLVIAIVVVVEGYAAIFRRENDFIFHRRLGTAFLTGHPYEPTGAWYPLARLMMDAVPAALPLRLSRAVCYVLAIVVLAYCFRKWSRWAFPRLADGDPRLVAAGVFTAAIALPIVLRDLDECGLQIYMLFFMTAGGVALCYGRQWQAGFWLATAVVYKLAPLIFLPLLVWKRQYRAAVAMVAFIGLWSVAPAVWIGWDETMKCNREWWAYTTRTFGAGDAYPSLLEDEPPKSHNLGLQAAIARYLETYPAGHPLVIDHPAFRQFGDLSPGAAALTVKAILLVFGLALAWRFSRNWSSGAAGVEEVRQWAAMCLLAALLAPLCWKQHLVVSLPAIFITVGTLLTTPERSRWRLGTLAVATAIVLLSRHGIVGRPMSIVLLSYKVDTLAMLLVLLLALTLPRVASTAASSAKTDLRQRLPQAA